MMVELDHRDRKFAHWSAYHDSLSGTVVDHSQWKPDLDKAGPGVF